MLRLSDYRRWRCGLLPQRAVPVRMPTPSAPAAPQHPWPHPGRGWTRYRVSFLFLKVCALSEGFTTQKLLCHLQASPVPFLHPPPPPPETSLFLMISDLIYNEGPEVPTDGEMV